MEVLYSNPTEIQGQIPSLFVWSPSLTWGSEPSQQWENFFGIIVTQFVGHPPGAYVWFYCDCAPPTVWLWFLYLWTWGIFFWQVPAPTYWWSFNSQFWFWCSHRKKWVHVLLFCHLKLVILIFWGTTIYCFPFSSVRLLSHVWLFETPWTAAYQASLSFTVSWSLLTFVSIQRSIFSSSVIPFSSCLQSFPASGSFLMSQFFTSGGQSIGPSASASVFPMNI